MDKSETTEALAAIGMMLQAFPSAQSSITADSPRVFLFAVEEYSLDALKRACRLIVRGEVKDLKPEFPPAAPKLAQIVKDCEGQLKVERFEAENLFVDCDSVLWAQIKLLRNSGNPPSMTRTLPGGRMVTGWYFKAEEVAQARQLALPPPVSPERLAEINDRLRARGLLIGDPEGDQDAA